MLAAGGWAASLVEGQGFRIDLRAWQELLKTLEPEQRAQLERDPQVRYRFLKHLAEVEALSRQARRAGLDREPAIRRRLEFLQKEYLARVWLEREVARRLKAFKLTEEDLRLYYRSHEEEFTGPDGKPIPFERVKGIIREKLIDQRRRALLEEIVREILAKEKVRLHPEALTPP